MSSAPPLRAILLLGLPGACDGDMYRPSVSATATMENVRLWQGSPALALNGELSANPAALAVMDRLSLGMELRDPANVAHESGMLALWQLDAAWEGGDPPASAELLWEEDVPGSVGDEPDKMSFDASLRPSGLGPFHALLLLTGPADVQGDVAVHATAVLDDSRAGAAIFVVLEQ